MNPPNYGYEFYTIHTDSLSSNTWEDGEQGRFTTHLFRPLKDVVQVSVLTASFDVSNSNVAYLNVNQLTSPFNDNTGEPNTGGGDSMIVSSIAAKDKTRTSMARFNVAASGRTEYNQQDFSTQTQFVTPIRKLDRITCELFDETGNLLTVNSNTFVSYRFTCMRNNMDPSASQRIKNK